MTAGCTFTMAGRLVSNIYISDTAVGSKEALRALVHESLRLKKSVGDRAGQ